MKVCGACRHFVLVPSKIIGQAVGQCYGAPPTPIAVSIQGQPSLSAARPTLDGRERACSLWSPLEDAANDS